MRQRAASCRGKCACWDSCCTWQPVLCQLLLASPSHHPQPLLLPLELWCVPVERGPGHLHQFCRLPLRKCSALTMESWFSRGSGTYSAISLQPTNIFRSAWPWAVPVDMKHVCVLIYSCPLFCRSFRHLLCWCPCQHNDLSHCQAHLQDGRSHPGQESQSQQLVGSALPRWVLPANVAQPQMQSSPRGPSQSPWVMDGRLQDTPPSALKWVSQISGQEGGKNARWNSYVWITGSAFHMYKWVCKEQRQHQLNTDFL